MLSNLRKFKKLLITLVCICFSKAYASEDVGQFKSNTVYPVSFFIDRTAERERIRDYLDIYKNVSLIGVSGVGKTQIARKYAEENKERYSVIWFFDLAVDINNQFAELSKMINQYIITNKTEKLSEDPIYAKTSVLNYFSERNDWLLIFDNLKLHEDNKVKDIVAWGHNGHLILCSQDSTNLPNIIPIYSLDEIHSKKLFETILNTNKLEKSPLINDFTAVFNGLPESIIVGAKIMKENKYLSFEEFSSILKKSHNNLLGHMQLIIPELSLRDKKLLETISLIDNQYFSKRLLINIFDDKAVGEGIYNLNKYGLIRSLESENINMPIFEMHDAVKEAVIKLTPKKDLKERLVYLIDRLNKMFPRGVSSRYALISDDKSIKSNLEVILKNAETLEVDIEHILALRKNLVDYYLPSLDYYHLAQFEEWLVLKERGKEINLSKISDTTKQNYAWYLTDIGVYNDWAKGDNIKALQYFEKAESISESLKDQPELKGTIFLQKAQALIYSGNISLSEKNIEMVDQIIKDYPYADLDMGLYWYIKARIALGSGQYEKALLYIENNIDFEKHLPRDTFTAPTFIVKTEILNYMNEYQKAYDVIMPIYSQEVGNKTPWHEIHARILAQLSRAQRGLGHDKDALKNAELACEIFESEIKKYNVTVTANTEYAAALVAKADALRVARDVESAFDAYNKAEIIYLRRYGKNFGTMDDISYLLYSASTLACKTNHELWKKHFYYQFIKYFDDSNVRLIDAKHVCAKAN